MNWEKTGRAVGLFFLTVIEYSFKLCATVAAAITIAAPGPFSDKISAGFGSLSQALRRLVDAPGKLAEMGTVVNDYNTMTAASFTETYGANTVSGLLANLNAAVEYLMSVGDNLSRSPLVTLTAAFLVFITFYLLSWVLRFTRQKGEGSYLVRLERKLGDKVFGRNAVPNPAGIASSVSESKSSAASSVKSSRPTPRVKPQMKPRSASPFPSSPSPSSSSSSASGSSSSSSPENVASQKPKKQSGENNGNGNRNVGKKKVNDYDPDPQTLTYILEAARSS